MKLKIGINHHWKQILTATACSVFVGCGATPDGISNNSDTGYTQVTETEISNYFGRKFSLDGNHIVLNEGGTFDGTWKSEPIEGTWEMKDGYWCRVLTVFFDAPKKGIEDCQLWEAKGDTVRGTRDRGKGISFIYAVK